MTQSHTPTPWKIKDANGKYLASKSKWTADYDGNAAMTSNVPIMAGKKTVALVVNVDKSWEDKQLDHNAEFIVRACNAHDDLVAASRLASDGICTVQDHLDEWSKEDILKHLYGLQRELEAALAKAKAV